MCLNYSHVGTGKVLDALRAGNLVFYKQYKVNFAEPRTLMAPFQHVRVSIEPDGTIRSNRESPALTKDERMSHQVERGIHVTAKTPSSWILTATGVIVVPVTVDPADFIASDGDHCVFSKVKVDPAEVERLMAEAEPEDDEDEDDEDDDVCDECDECGEQGCDGECIDDEEEDEWDEDDDPDEEEDDDDDDDE